MKSIFKTLLACSVLLGALAGCNNSSSKSDKVTLQLKYEKGFEKTIYTVTKASQGDMMSMNSIMELKFKLDSVMGDTYRFLVDVNRITSYSKMYDEVEDYDSDKPESKMTEDEKAVHADFRDVLESEFFIEIDKQGKIIKPFYYKNGTLYSGDIIEMATIQILFPDHEIEIGDEWKNETTVSLTNQKKQFTYTLKEVNDKEIVIEMKAEVEGLKSMTGSTVLMGTYHLDRKTNQLIKAVLNSNMSGGGKMNMTIDQK
ncbi:MAG: DUF6263 family protein [Bacteroidota bacterium]